MVYTREPSVSFVSVYNKQDGIQKTETVKLIDRGVKTTNRQAETGYMIALDEHENNPVVTIRTKQLADHLKLNVSDKVFARHEAVSLSLRAICNGDTPELITNYQLSPFLVEG
ncbi:unnamed protein product [Anisakis simplex]|uniref:Lipoprotein n=1 Tax=Anisakis simplex TaxID=6269 RepID=A0A0M3IZ96_ANISI|nr:unnamed protein product [Anisakis simplex]